MNNILVILIGILRACNTRKVQHSSAKQSFKKKHAEKYSSCVWAKRLGAITQSKREAAHLYVILQQVNWERDVGWIKAGKRSRQNTDTKSDHNYNFFMK